jgi:hypothetical protein
MICARVVMNSGVDRETSCGTVLYDIRSIVPDPETGDIVLIGRDAGLDAIELRAPFGRTIEIYH